MGDEQFDVGSAVSLSGKTKVTEEYLSVNNQYRDSDKGGDGDEIMVEIVGSDVFFDGVGGDNGGNFGIEEIGDLYGNTLDNREESGTHYNSEATKDVVSEGYGKEMGKIDPLNAQGREKKLVRDDNIVGPELMKHPIEEKITTEEKEATNNGANEVQVEVSEVSQKPDSEAPKDVVEESSLSEAREGLGLASSNVEPVVSVSDVHDEKSVTVGEKVVDTEFDDVRSFNTNEGLATDVVRENSANSDQTSLAGGGCSSKVGEEVNEEKSINGEAQVDSDQAHVATSVINDQKDQFSYGEVLEGDTCNEKVEGIDSEVSLQSSDHRGTDKIFFPCDGHTVETLVPDVYSGDDSRKHNGYHMEQAHTSEAEASDVNHETEHHGGNKEPPLETMNFSNRETSRPQGQLKMNQLGYLSLTETDDHFSPGDLVWGKIRSHPWWPGQVFDTADASELALKYFKKDSYLVAYFGDHTFAWNDPSVLKHFGPDFSQIEKQSNSEAFQNAVDCALKEVSRRTELGLTCSCIPKEAYGEIEAQVVENTGLREESSQRYGLDESFGPVSFEPDKLLRFVRGLASSTTSGADRLDLAIARAQLSGFCRFKGYRLPGEFPSVGEETDADVDWMDDEVVMTRRRKHVPEDATESKKERSIAELMHREHHHMEAEEESDEKMSVYGAKVSASTSQTPKPSFRIGECIRRVASQLTGAASSAKSNDDEHVQDVSINKLSEGQSVAVSLGSSSVDEMLSQLQLLAQIPRKKQDVCIPTRKFFSLFRSSIALNKRGRKKKKVAAGEFEFDDVNDSYWRDKIVQNYPGEQLLWNNENGNLQRGPKPHSRKRYSTGSYPMEATEEEAAKRRKQESSPAELILNFAERSYIPAEINLNKIFRRFGPIMESETEVDVESGRARVIFKRGSDAEVAHSSAEKFNIFGPALVNYQIGYTPVISVKVLPMVVGQSQENPTLMA